MIKMLFQKCIHKINYYLVRRDPVKLARFLGVNFPEDGLHIYGDVAWNTEPWIITLGKNVHITNGVRFLTHDGGTLLFRDSEPDLEVTKPIVVGDNVYIGNNVLLMPGICVGNNVVIGAGAVVTKDIPDNVVVGGVPARVIESLEQYHLKLQRSSLHVGHLTGKKKDDALKAIYGYKRD